MVISSAEENCSTKALLSLFIDGKEISDIEIEEPLKALCKITDIRALIEEVYLLSMYHCLSPVIEKEELILAINRIENSIEGFLLEELQNVILYYKFLFAKVLCGLEVENLKKMPSFAKPDYLSKLDDLALLGSLSLFVGCFLQKPAFFEEGCLIAELIFDLVNDKGEVDVFFFFEKGAYQKDACRVSVFILLSLYSCTTDDFKISEILSRIDPYQGGLFQSLEVGKRLQCRLLEIVKPYTSDVEKRIYKKNFSNELIKIKSGKFSYLTSKEKKVGIGSVSFDNKLIIPSFGPHILPLGKNDLYGLNKPINQDVNSSADQVKMWNRVKSKCHYGNHWIYTNITAKDDKIKMDSFIWSEKKDEQISLIFFLRGSEIEIDDRKYLSGGLERVAVKSDKIALKVEGERMQIHLKEKTEIEIIPLAGQQYFWNSDFIVSLPFVLSRIITLELVID